MSEIVDWMAAEAEKVGRPGVVVRRVRVRREDVGDMAEHSFPGRNLLPTEGQRGESLETWTGARASCPCDSRLGAGATVDGGLRRSEELEGGTRNFSEEPENLSVSGLSWEEERERRTYRRRTVRMLRRYMRYSIETGRLPSLLGREFFRAPVTPYNMVTFEDRVIFVHDMETCLNKLDEFSREIIARHVLQEHDQEATAKFLHCTGRTVRTYVPIALDLLSEILLDVELLERTFPIREKPCQGGKTGESLVSDSEESKNKS